jgi:hypothetical protein
VRLSVRSKGRERAGQSSRVSSGKTPSRFGPFRAGARKRTVGCLSSAPDREALLLLNKTDPLVLARLRAERDADRPRERRNRRRSRTFAS